MRCHAIPPVAYGMLFVDMSRYFKTLTSCVGVAQKVKPWIDSGVRLRHTEQTACSPPGWISSMMKGFSALPWSESFSWSWLTDVYVSAPPTCRAAEVHCIFERNLKKKQIRHPVSWLCVTMAWWEEKIPEIQIRILELWEKISHEEKLLVIREWLGKPSVSWSCTYEEFSRSAKIKMVIRNYKMSFFCSLRIQWCVRMTNKVCLEVY